MFRLTYTKDKKDKPKFINRGKMNEPSLEKICEAITNGKNDRRCYPL